MRQPHPGDSQNAYCLYTMKNDDDESEYEGSESGGDSDGSSDGGSYDYGFVEGERKYFIEHQEAYISPPIRRKDGGRHTAGICRNVESRD